MKALEAGGGGCRARLELQSTRASSRDTDVTDGDAREATRREQEDCQVNGLRTQRDVPRRGAVERPGRLQT